MVSSTHIKVTPLLSASHHPHVGYSTQVLAKPLYYPHCSFSTLSTSTRQIMRPIHLKALLSTTPSHLTQNIPVRSSLIYLLPWFQPSHTKLLGLFVSLSLKKHEFIFCISVRLLVYFLQQEAFFFYNISCVVTAATSLFVTVRLGIRTSVWLSLRIRFTQMRGTRQAMWYTMTFRFLSRGVWYTGLNIATRYLFTETT